MMQSDSELRLAPATAFTEGAYVEEHVRGPTGSRIGGIVVLAGGIALATAGVVLYASAPASTLSNPAAGFEDEYLGVIGMIAGGFATVGGITMIALSDPWRVDARLGPKPTASLKLNERGLELAAGTTHAWLTPLGAHGSF